VMIFCRDSVLQYFIIKNVFPLSLSFSNIWIFFFVNNAVFYLFLSHKISFHERETNNFDDGIGEVVVGKCSTIEA
jgi:hypothetical protein